MAGLAWGRIVLVALGLVASSTINADALAGGRAPDFNGDGFADMPVGVPLEDFAGQIDAGAVNIIYGTASGLRASRDQFWTQNSASIKDLCEAGDRFGSALAWGDFNGDGFDDLAIGVPNEDIGGFMDAGAVTVLYGSADGLSAAGNQFWSQNTAGILGTSDVGDQFGSTLAVGDF